MKRISILISLTVILSLIISSCSSTATYAQELQLEKTTIQNYIKREGINVISSFPAKNTKWKDNDYVLTSDGLYFHLVDTGYVSYPGDTLELKDKIVARYSEFTLNVPSDTTVNSLSVLENPFPSTFVYGNTAQSCTGFQEAVSYMKRNGATAKLIIPSKIGFYASDTNAATPYGYTLNIKIQK
jgi:hypothetical protein